MSPELADSVAKVGEELPANKNSQESNRAERIFEINDAHWRPILNQCCALGCAKSFCNKIGPTRKLAAPPRYVSNRSRTGPTPRVPGVENDPSAALARVRNKPTLGHAGLLPRLASVCLAKLRRRTALPDALVLASSSPDCHRARKSTESLAQ